MGADERVHEGPSSLLTELALLSAAASSPGAVHRLPTLRSQWFHTIGNEEAVRRPGATVAQRLSEALKAAEGRDPLLVMTEDWWPSDPRLLVTFKYRGRRWRIHPGRHVDPLDVLETLVDVAEATRRAAERMLGFSGEDLIEVALILMSNELAVLAPCWPAGNRGGPDVGPNVQMQPDSFGEHVRQTPVVVSEPEVEVVRRFLCADRLGAAAASALWPAQAARAAEWATLNTETASGPDAESALAVRREHRRWPVPSGLLLTQLQESIQRLVELVADDDSTSRLHETAKRRAHTLLYATAITPAGPAAIKPAIPTAPAPTANSPGLGTSRHPAPPETQEPPHSASFGLASDPAHDSDEDTGAGPDKCLSVRAAQMAHPDVPAEPDAAGEAGHSSRPAAAATEDWTHPDAVLKLGRRLITVDVVPMLRVPDAQPALQAAHARAMGRTVEEILTCLPVRPNTDGLVVLRVLLLHGIVDVKAAHTGGFAITTLPVLRRILRDADDSDTGRDLLCQFLEDLTVLPPNVEYMLPADYDDIWTHWTRHGGLVPASAGRIEPHTVVLVAPTLHDPMWPRAAELEPLETLADAAGIPGSQGLPGVMASRDQLLVLGPGGVEAAYLMAPDSVVITAPREAADATTAHAVASALCKALHTSGLAAAAAGREGLYRLYVSFRDEDRLSLRGSVDGGWELGFPESFLRHAVTDAPQVHALLGEALATPHKGRPGVADALAAWQRMPPTLVIGLHASPCRAHTETTLVIESRASENRAGQLILHELPTDVAAGLYTGETADELVRTVLYPAAMRAFARATRHLHGVRAVRAALAAADAAHQARAERRQMLDVGLRSADADAFRAEVLSRPDDARLTRGLEVLAEQLLAHPGEGSSTLDRFDIADLAAICEAALTWTIGADHARRGSSELILRVTKRGGVVTRARGTAKAARPLHNDEAGSAEADEEDDPSAPSTRSAGENASSPGGSRNGGTAPEPIRVDAEAWLQAVRAGLLEYDPGPPTLPDEHDGQFRRVLDGPEVPGRLGKLDGVMRTHLGCGIEAIVAVLATAAGWSDDTDLPQTTAAALAAETAEWAEPIPPAEFDAAISLLTLTGPQVAADSSIWEQERRAQRLLLRPLVSVDGQLYIPRHICRALQDVTAEFLGDGRLPWPDLPAEVTRAANEFRQIGNNSLERHAEVEAQTTGLAVIANLQPHDAAAAGIVGLPGEIDLLVGNAATSTTQRVEVKDHVMTASGYSVNQRVQRFASRKGYEAKLLKKTTTISQHADAAATLLGLPRAPVWTVTPVMATRRVEPAAFNVIRTRVEYVLVDHLADHLSGSSRRYGLRSH
jgi:hypothetical protein